MRLKRLQQRNFVFLKGAAVIEFALILPLLLLILLPLADIARAIQADTILVNLSREGANIAARGASIDTISSQNLMNALASTTPPLDMPAQGMIYISKIMGHKQGGFIRNIMLEQYHWKGNSSYLPSSLVSNCTLWQDGKCSSIDSNPDLSPTASVMTGLLADGQVIYAVEVFYHFENLITLLNFPQLPPDLYAISIF